MTYGDQKVKDFVEILASSAPVPGGGSVAALAGALGVSLLTMVAEITMGKKRPEDKTAIEEALKTLTPMRARFVELMDEDAAAFKKVMAAFKLPKGDESQIRARADAVEQGTIGAAAVPLETARTALAALAAGDVLAEQGSKSAVSDVACGALCLEAAARAAGYNILINLAGIENAGERTRFEGALKEIEKRLGELARVREKAAERMA